MDRNESLDKEINKPFKISGLVFSVSLFIIAVVSGGSVYVWQQSIFSKTLTQCQFEKNNLDKQLSVARTDIAQESTLSYSNTNYGFAFNYPTDWSVYEYSSEQFDVLNTVVRVESPIKTVVGGKSVSADTIQIYYYEKIADEPETKDSNPQSIQELVDTNPLVVQVGTISVGGQEGIEVEWGGYGIYYTVLVSIDGNLYKIQFSNIENKMKLTDEHKGILSSFSFF